MDELLTQRPTGANKYINVGDILKMAEDLKRREIPKDQLVLVAGITGFRGELRGLCVSMHKKG